jgi:hypothetical protein
MRYASLLALALVICACADDDSEGPRASAGKGGSHSAAGAGGSHSQAGNGGTGSNPVDAGHAGIDAGENASKLDRPGTLPPPPKDRLPSDLRPPR